MKVPRYVWYTFLRKALPLLCLTHASHYDLSRIYYIQKLWSHFLTKMALIILLEMYTMDDIIVDTDAKVRRCMYLSNIFSIKYAKSLWNQALRCERLYGEHVLIDISIEGLPESVRHSMCSLWLSKNKAKVHYLTQHVALQTKLQMSS